MEEAYGNHEGRELNGHVTDLYLKTERGGAMQRMTEVRAVDKLGLEGDASFGRSKRQVLIIEAETLDAFALKPGVVRENIVTRGVSYAGSAKGTQIVIGTVRLEVTMDCTPCPFIDTIRAGLANEIRGRRGTLCRVIQGGLIKEGDPIEVLSGPITPA